MDTTSAAPVEHPPVAAWEWKGLLRRARLDFATKAIGRAIADYADHETGEDIFPGVAHLVVDTGASASTVKRGLATLRRLGLIRMTKRGNRRRGHADEYALAIPEDAEDRGLVVLTPDEYKAAVKLAASSGVTQTHDEPDQGSQGPVIGSIRGHCDPPPTTNPYQPSKSNHPDELALGPELTTACAPEEETPMSLSPEEIEDLRRQGVRGPALARAALAAAGRPWVAPEERPVEPLPPTSRWRDLMADIEDRLAAALSGPLAAEPGGVRTPAPPEWQEGSQGAALPA